MREVVRCIHCQLNQFVTVSGLCRKCRKNPFFVPVPEPELEPEPVVVTQAIVIENPNYKCSLTPVTRALPIVFRACRLTRGMTQKQLGAAISVPRSYVSRVENDKITPATQSVLHLARGLNLSPRFILEMAEAMASA